MRLLISAIIVITLPVLNAFPRTWNIEQDGTGEWLTIQAAVDASASGDTILIGPGRYDQLHAATDGQTAVVYWNSPKSLAFIGEDSETVIIGPSAPVHNSNGIFCGAPAFTTIENLSFENLETAVLQLGGGDVAGCRVADCDDGFSFFSEAGFDRVTVVNCEFFARPDVIDGSFLYAKDFDQVTVEDCLVTDMQVRMQDVAVGLVQGNEFNNLVNEIATDFNRSNVEFLNNIVDGGSVGSQNLGRVVVHDNHFKQSPLISNLNAANQDLVVEIHDNVFEGAAGATIYILYGATVIGSGNHILKGSSEYSVRVIASDPLHLGTIDLRGNYWGVTDSTSISGLIWDVNDDPELLTEVLFMPFADQPLPPKQKNFGSFKAMFR